MKRREFLKTLGLKTGLDQTEIDEILNDLEGDIDDAKADGAIKSVYTGDEALGNDTLFQKAIGKGKAEALNPIDTMLKTFESKLKVDEKTAYGKLDTSHKKYQFMLKSFSERETPTGDANYDTLKTEFETLKGDVDTKYVKREDHEAVVLKASNAQKQSFKTRLAIAAGKKLGDSANVRHFEDNFFNDALDLVQSVGIGKSKVKGVIDFETGKIMKADSPDQPLLHDSKVLTIADIADMAIEAYEYKPPVSAPAPVGVVKLPTGSSDKKDSNEAARKRNFQLEDEE